MIEKIKKALALINYFETHGKKCECNKNILNTIGCTCGVGEIKEMLEQLREILK